MSTPTPPHPPDANSYTAMETADVEAIGSHCQMPFCRQLDFLPFRCDSCHSTYCLDHRLETSHSCPKAGEWARNRRLQNTTSTATTPLSSKPTVLTAQQCSDPACKTFINTTQSQAIHCQTCNRHYCLKHRFPEEHSCKTLTPLGARPAAISLQSNADKIKQGFGRLRVWSKDKQETLLPRPKPKPTSKSAQIAALATLKRTSKGDAKIPLEKRVHLHVEASPLYSSSSSSTSPPTTSTQPVSKPLFFSADHPVGRLLDEAAKSLGVENVNNRAQVEEQKLRVYHVESGTVLAFGDKVGGKLKSGDTVVLLRGVGDPGV